MEGSIKNISYHESSTKYTHILRISRMSFKSCWNALLLHGGLFCKTNKNKIQVPGCESENNWSFHLPRACWEAITTLSSHQIKVRAKSFQSCPMDCNPPGSSVHWILQARILEWVTLSSSRDLPNPRVKSVSLRSPAQAGGFFTTSATWGTTK